MHEYIEFKKTESGHLELKITPEGLEMLQEMRDQRITQRTDVEEFVDLIEYQLCNGWELLNDFDIQCVGGLTSCPFILTDDVVRNEEGDIKEMNSCWWYIDYMVKSPVNDDFLGNDRIAVFMNAIV